MLGNYFSSKVFNFTKSLFTALVSSANSLSDMPGRRYSVKTNSLPSLFASLLALLARALCTLV